MSGPGETADRSRASDAAALPYAVSAEDGGNPFAREGGSYDSVRPAYPDEAVAALLGAVAATCLVREKRLFAYFKRRR